jgi:hypothetical protein
MRFSSNGIVIHRLWCTLESSSNRLTLTQLERDNKTGEFKVVEQNMNALLQNPAGRLAVCGWGTTNGPELRVYCQNDTGKGPRIWEYSKSGSEDWKFRPKLETPWDFVLRA